MSSRHKMISVPNIGDLDWAYEIEGIWEVQFEYAMNTEKYSLRNVHKETPGSFFGIRPDACGHVLFSNWDFAEMSLDGEQLAEPFRDIELSRFNFIKRSPDKTGALIWGMESDNLPCVFQFALWPSKLLIFVTNEGEKWTPWRDNNENQKHLGLRMVGIANRPDDYWKYKYPLNRGRRHTDNK